MLKNIPPILSPELLKVLAEMGHGDRICIGDGNFPGASMAKPNNCVFLRADGHGVPELLDAILQVIPLDEYLFFGQHLRNFIRMRAFQHNVNAKRAVRSFPGPPDFSANPLCRGIHGRYDSQPSCVAYRRSKLRI